MTLSYSPLLTLAVAALLVGMLIGLLGGVALGRWVLPDCPEVECMPQIYPELPPCDCEPDYYRGIFDTWAWMSKTTGLDVDLWAIIQAAIDKDWYAEPSPGWVWPPPTPGPSLGESG